MYIFLHRPALTKVTLSSKQPSFLFSFFPWIYKNLFLFSFSVFISLSWHSCQVVVNWQLLRPQTGARWWKIKNLVEKLVMKRQSRCSLWMVENKKQTNDFNDLCWNQSVCISVVFAVIYLEAFCNHEKIYWAILWDCMSFYVSFLL